MGKRNLADEGVEFNPCSPDTHRLRYENRVLDVLREAYEGVTYKHDLMLVNVFGRSRYPPVCLTEEELSEGEMHGLTLLGWSVDRRHAHHVVTGPRTSRHGVCPLTGPVPLLQQAGRPTIFEKSSI